MQMYISRIVVRNFRTFLHLDVALKSGATCIVGENNTGKSNLIFAIRLALDLNLSSALRHLSESDFHTGIDIATPQQIVISLELNGWADNDSECALVGTWGIDANIARVTFRFRPKRSVRDEIEAETREPNGLVIDDYEWELICGGGEDPADVEWDKDCGTGFRLSDLQALQVVCLPALRDVEQDLRYSRHSALGKLLSTSEMPTEEREELVKILRDANQEISARPTIQEMGSAIDGAFEETAGEAFPLDVKLGMSDPSFGGITKSLMVLLSNDAMTDFDTSRNGLGLNNMLYISILMEYFERRLAAKKYAGELLLIEEPEAHLHPQLQRTLYAVLATKTFQTIITTHSTYITSSAPLSSLVVLTNSGTPAISSSVPGSSLTAMQTADLERYLDATRSALLFARKVILVEGPAEWFVLPPLIKQVLHKDFDRLGISVVPIFGVHFDVYAKLFGPGRIEKKCVIIADADLSPSDAGDSDLDESETCPTPNLSKLENEYVKVFQCSTTFERALTVAGCLRVLAAATDECNIKSVSASLSKAHTRITNGVTEEEKKDLLESLRPKVLNAAKRVGKGRFGQLVAKHAALATTVPKYLKDAVDWLVS